MAALAQLLGCLDRADISEIIVRTGQAITARIGQQHRPLTSAAISAVQLQGLLGELSSLSGSGQPETLLAGGKTYLVTIDRRPEATMILITKAAAAATPPPEPRKADLPPPQPTRAPTAASMPAAEAVAPAPRSPSPVVHPAPTLSAPPAHREEPPKTPPPRIAVGRFEPQFDPEVLQLFRGARERKCSDLHIVAGRPALMRSVGSLNPVGAGLEASRVEKMLLPLLDPRSVDQLARLGYCDQALDVPGAGRVRANVNQQKTGLKGCFRLIAEQPPRLDELGLPEELAKVTTYHQGLAVVSGPNGHGKTTTMAALVDLINGHKAGHIITVEDPVEIVHPIKRAVISQRQVGTHTDSFQAALKGALREDPDVIVIGELRDLETVEMALSAAETGHLVIATMSTPSGAKTIDRLIDMFPPGDQSQVRATLAGALKIIVSQRLLPSADGTRLYAAAELITGNVPLWNLIRDDKLYQLPSLLQRGRAFGMIRFEDSLRQLLAEGKITMETAMRVSSDPRYLKVDPAAAEPLAFKPPVPGDSKGGLRGLFRKES